jgi:hypothetical protein
VNRLLAVCAGLLLTPPLSGQIPADSATLARTVATSIAEELLLDAFPDAAWLVVPPETPFETSVFRELVKIPRFSGWTRDSAQAIRLELHAIPEYLQMRSEYQGLPAVLVVTSACQRSSHWPGGWHYWRNATYYVFRPGDAVTWELFGGGTLDNADGTCQPPRRQPRRGSGG